MVLEVGPHDLMYVMQLPPREEQVHVNLLVVGASGLGKTTFIRQVFQDFQSKKFQPHDGSATHMDDFMADSDSLCTHLEESVSSDDGSYLVHYHIQDTPGDSAHIEIISLLLFLCGHHWVCIGCLGYLHCCRECQAAFECMIAG